MNDVPPHDKIWFAASYVALVSAAGSPVRASKIIGGCGQRSGPASVGRGYFVARSEQRNVTDEKIAEYIRLQGGEPQDDGRFQVSEE